MNTVNDYKILIVDNDHGHLELIKRNLQRYKITNAILLFHDGESVMHFLDEEKNLNKWSNGESYIILLDIRMPGTSGIEVLQRLRQDEKWKAVPVIMITTTDDPLEVERCFELGCSNYFTKPVNYPQLVQQIKNCTDYKQLEAGIGV